VIQLSLVGVRVEVPTNQPIVLLREVDGSRHLPIFIGAPEATAIVYALQGMETPRPMTHDLFKRALDELNAEIVRVEITGLREGTFFAKVHLDVSGTAKVLDSRPSDALALAARYGDSVPIYADSAVLDEAGVEMEPEQLDGDTADRGPIGEEEIDEFREFLDQISPDDFA
jgi:uncharacterized protein